MTLRARLLALLTMAPAIATALGLAAIEGYRVGNPDAPLFGEPPARTFLEAVQRGNQGMEEAYRFVAAGLDPNGPLTVTDEELTAGRTLTTTPLMLAVAAGNRNVVMMLLNFGARLDLPQHALAVCLARKVNSEAVLSVLEAHIKADVSPECRESGADAEAPALVMFASQPAAG